MKRSLKPRSTGIKQINVDSENIQKGLAKLVLVIIELLRQVLERQASRRISSGTLTAEEVERLGTAFMQIKQVIADMSDQFGFSPRDLDISIGRQNNLANTSGGTTLVDLVDHLLEKGVVLGGQIRISVADIDLIMLDLLGAISAVHAAKPRRRRK